MLRSIENGFSTVPAVVRRLARRVAPGVPGQDGQVVLGEGDYVLVCSSPGHASDGMVYRLTVR